MELEIGFGWDPFLLEKAAATPAMDFVGLEYDRKRVKWFVQQAAARGLSNVRAVMGEASHCLPGLFAPGQLARAYIHFPDPWPKKRHQKNRLLDGRFFQLLLYHVKDTGELIIGTDSAEYRDFIIAGLSALPGVANGCFPRPWVDRLPGHPETKFERVFRNQGKEIFYLLYRRTEDFSRHNDAGIEALKVNLPARVTAMPHVIFKQPLDLDHFMAGFCPFQWQDGLALYKVIEVWRSSRRSGMLLEAVIIADGHDELFYVDVAVKPKGTVMRISPMKEVERTELLFRFMGGLMRHFQALYPELTVMRHNLGRHADSGSKHV